MTALELSIRVEALRDLATESILKRLAKQYDR